MRFPAKKTLASYLAAFGLRRELRYLYNDKNKKKKRRRVNKRFCTNSNRDRMLSVMSDGHSAGH